MSSIILKAESLKKQFDRKIVFHDLGFVVHAKEGLGVTGRNGSGKSTLVKIVSSILSPTAGEVRLEHDGTSVQKEKLYRHVGFVAPYLQLYDEFTAWENLHFVRRVRGLNAVDSILEHLLEKVNLIDRKDSYLRTYSSGMKQRLRYAFALLHEPEILILDEPTSNLDVEGIDLVHEIMQEQVGHGILVVATNEERDLLHCSTIIDMNAFVEEKSTHE